MHDEFLEAVEEKKKKDSWKKKKKKEREARSVRKMTRTKNEKKPIPFEEEDTDDPLQSLKEFEKQQVE